MENIGQTGLVKKVDRMSQQTDSSVPLAHIFQAYRDANPQRDYERLNGQARAAGLGKLKILLEVW